MPVNSTFRGQPATPNTGWSSKKAFDYRMFTLLMQAENRIAALRPLTAAQSGRELNPQCRPHPTRRWPTERLVRHDQ